MKEIEKDITTIDEGLVIHGVNCQRKMASGVAKEIRAKWPIVYEKYMNAQPKLGATQIVHIKEQLWVCNCYTQQYYGYDGKAYADIIAIEKCLRFVARLSAESTLPIYMPRIGCGLGGLDWNYDLIPLIEEVEERFPKAQFIVCVYGE